MYCQLLINGWFPNLTRAYDNNGRCPRQKFVLGILQLFLVGWFPNLTRAYDNNGRCPRQKFVFGILQLYWLVSQFDEGLWQQWPLPSTEICFWHITALLVGFPIWRGPMTTMAVALDRNLFWAYYSYTALSGWLVSLFDEGLCFWHITAQTSSYIWN